jgi:hypothetical protein
MGTYRQIKDEVRDAPEVATASVEFKQQEQRINIIRAYEWIVS